MSLPFPIEMALSALGLSDVQKAEVENNTIPAIDDLVSLYNNNPHLVSVVTADINKLMPGVQILLDAMRKKSMTVKQVLEEMNK